MKFDPVEWAWRALLVIVTLFLVFNISMCTQSWQVSINLNRYLSGGEVRTIATVPLLRRESALPAPKSI